MVTPNATLFHLTPEQALTPAQAKKIIVAELANRGITVTKVSAKTVGFSDLARASCVFVTVAGYPFDGENGQNTNVWHSELKSLAVSKGFRLVAA